MKFTYLVLGLIFILTGCQTAEKEEDIGIWYQISFPNAVHNEAEVSVTVSELDPIPLQFTMSRTSPGRYALHEFAKNVYNVTAVDGDGDTLEILHPNLHNWIVSGHDGTVNFHYTLYADHADGTYSGVNEEHAHLNIPATFVWIQGYETEPVTIQFDIPDDSNWKVATQLRPTGDPFVFKAPDVYYFLDSPVELSDFVSKEWQVASSDTTHTIRLVIHHDGSDSSANEYASMARKVVDEQIAVYDEIPQYDYGVYTFIADYLPYVYGDGMEHRNSTILTSPRSLEEHALDNLYTLSHEYFHGWNVERIRPRSLEPFDFSNAGISRELWFGEGFTSYYDDLVIRRAGLIDTREYARGWEETLNYVYNSPGSRFYSPVEMSMQAPFVDAATSVDAQNKSNTFISYYSWGSVIGLGLDLMLRSTFEEVTLDDYMRAMWQKFGKSEIPYTLLDLENTLAEVTDSTEFASSFFKKYVRGNQLINLKQLLARAGIVLQKANPGQAAIDWGINKINFENQQAEVTENTLIGSPLYRAGIDREDVILSIDGQKLSNARDLQRLLASQQPGDRVKITYISLGTRREGELVFIEDPTLEMVPYEDAGMELTEQMKAFRQSWLGSKQGT